MNFQKLIKNSQKELKLIKETKKSIYVKAKFGPSKITKIPLQINEDLAFLAGAIIGDGHLKKSKFQITIELSNKRILEEIQKIGINLFERNFNINPVKKRVGRKQNYVLLMDSKAIYNLLNIPFEIPKGKKSDIVKIPDAIKKANKKIKLSFLRGILETEGGNRRRMYGLSTASKQLWKDLIELLEELKIFTYKDKWIYKKTNKEYYGIAFKPNNLKIIMQGCRSGQTE